MGILGIPGLDGYRAAVQDTQARDANQIGLLGGVMNLQNAMFEHQLTPLKVEQLRLAVDAARTNQAIKSRIAGGLLPGAAPAEAPQGVLGAPQSGGGMFAPAPQGANGLPADIQAALLSGDPGLSAWAKEQAKTFAPTDRQRDARVLGYAPGTPEYNAFVGTQYNQGGAWIPDGKGGIKLAPGYAGGMGDIKGAEAAANAQYDFIDVPMPGGGTQKMSRAEFAKMRQPAAPVSAAPQVMGIDGKAAPAQDQAALRAIYDAEQRGVPATVQAPSQAIGRTPSEAESTFQKELGSVQAKSLIDSQKAAEDSAMIINTANEGRKLLDSGVISGFGADFMVKMGQALKQAGIDYGGDALTNSQAYVSNMANNVGRVIKQFGSGTGLSDADREYAAKIAGGSIALDEPALRKILDIGDRQARWVIQQHNKKAAGVNSQIPLIVDEPARYSRKTEQPSAQAIVDELKRRGVVK